MPLSYGALGMHLNTQSTALRKYPVFALHFLSVFAVLSTVRSNEVFSPSTSRLFEYTDRPTAGREGPAATGINDIYRGPQGVAVNLGRSELSSEEEGACRACEIFWEGRMERMKKKEKRRGDERTNRKYSRENNGTQNKPRRPARPMQEQVEKTSKLPMYVAILACHCNLLRSISLYVFSGCLFVSFQDDSPKYFESCSRQGRSTMHGQASRMRSIDFQVSKCLFDSLGCVVVSNQCAARLSHTASHWRPPLPLLKFNTSRFSHRLV